MKQFTKKELEFLSNFSSIEELETFTSKIDNSIEKLKARVANIESSNPELLYGAGGALLGAGIGAGTSLLVGENKKDKLRKALEAGAMGALLGTVGGVAGGIARGNSIREKLALKRIEDEARHKTVMEMLKNEDSIDMPVLAHEVKPQDLDTADKINSVLGLGVSDGYATKNPYAGEIIQGLIKNK